MQKISNTEIYFIENGINSNLRADGRSRNDYRHFSLETGEIIHASGSARLKISDTEVLVGVKAEIKEIKNAQSNNDKQQEDLKRFIFTVDCCQSASSEFTEQKRLDQYNIELAKQLERLYSHPSVVDVDKYLTIVPGKFYWNLCIDAMVLDSDGNLLDALSIAIRAALYNTVLPKIKVITSEYQEITFEVSEDPEDVISLKDAIENVPIFITLNQIGSQSSFIIDSTLQEELCINSKLCIGINQKSMICSIQKSSGMEGLEPQTIIQMIKSAKQIGVQIISTMDKALKLNP
ncbi:hypothetical protein DLAC_06826 [Tieghemostelium lacteum]|uniref:Ribosomal RNA-processing protein 42 n=1 Tax=Tieghemostelium lacteum TaxID=361077 RepID=A0A151ZDG5_TIELA|nr:hypothetical protein DLAC_06826 [Tieghemostelium lacteum]|eukprot:KYQ92002.1 hypothetical protein DLAC_06826 [Tieghemostelium lacteum]